MKDPDYVERGKKHATTSANKKNLSEQAKKEKERQKGLESLRKTEEEVPERKLSAFWELLYEAQEKNSSLQAQ